MTSTLKKDPEKDDGNNEYKLILQNKSQDRIAEMATQMRYRLLEGHGECFYTLGIQDDGTMIGLNEVERKDSEDVLYKVCQLNDYFMQLVSKTNITPCKTVYEYSIRENNSCEYIDIKTALAGNVDSGKSTLLSVLIHGCNDNGRGQARLNIFNYNHEVSSGRTSSIAQHILGFDSKGDIVNYNHNDGRKKTWQDIVHDARKVVTFFDLCGHEKYLKTTIRGLTSHNPDIIFILVGANMGISKMTREHISLCLSLNIPFAIIMTKIDIGKQRPQIMKDTLQNIRKLITSPGIRRVALNVKNIDDIMVSIRNINSQTVTPIFQVSSVTGEGLNNLKQFLSLYNPYLEKKGEKNCEKNCEKKYDIKEENVEMFIDSTFQVKGIGLVVGGQLNTGHIKAGDLLLIGPINNKYQRIVVKSIHVKRVLVQETSYGRYVCLALPKLGITKIPNGTVIISPRKEVHQVREFQARVRVLNAHSTTIRVGYEPIIHVASLRQVAKIVDIHQKKSYRNQNICDDILRIGDRATVTFRFTYHAQYIKTGMKILLADGKVKVDGQITEVSKEPCEQF